MLTFHFYSQPNSEDATRATLYVVHAEARHADGRVFYASYAVAPFRAAQPNFPEQLAAICAELKTRVVGAFDFSEAVS